MTDDLPTDAAVPSQPEVIAAASAAAPRTRRTLGSLLRAALSWPGQMLTLARAGRASEASMRCLLAGGMGYGFAMLWSFATTACAMLVLVPFYALSGPLEGADWIGNVLYFVIMAPSVLAVALAVLAPLAGVLLGLVGIFQSRQRLIGGLGAVLNLGLLMVLAVTAIGIIGLAG